MGTVQWTGGTADNMGGARAYSANHTIDPATGFLENPAYPMSFDGERKTQFLAVYKANGLKCRDALKTLGISYHTFNSHYHQDPVFKQAFDDLQRDYAEELEATSMSWALNPKGVIDRMCQLRRFFPQKYALDKMPQAPQVIVNVGGKGVEIVERKTQTLDAIVLNSDENTRHSSPLEYTPTETSPNSNYVLMDAPPGSGTDEKKDALPGNFPSTEGGR